MPAIATVLSVTFGVPAFAQTIVFNGYENYKPNAINVAGRFFLSVEDLNYIFQDVYGLDVNNYAMFFDELEPPAMEHEGAVFVPIRAFSEGLGWKVDWVNEQVIINFPEEYINLEEFLEDWIPVAPEISENPGITGALHRVTHEDNTAYIFGSAHAGLGHWFPLADVVEEAMAVADVFAFETNLFDPSDAELQDALEAMTRLTPLPAGQTLVDILPESLYQQFVEAVESFGLIEYEVFSNMNPAATIQEIVSNYVIPLAGLDWGYSVDAYVATVAMILDRAIIGLVPISLELEALLDLPAEVLLEQVESFGSRDQVMADFNQELEVLNVIVTAYENNDIEALREVIAYAFSLYTAQTPAQIHNRDVVNFARSIRFGQAVEQLLHETQQPTTFFVTVGISHVIRGGRGLQDDGITNVIRFLEHAGFEVEVLH